MVEKTLEAEGFKMTDAGPIPKDWNEIYLSEALLGNPKYGVNAAAVEYTESLPTYLRITDISNDGHFISSDKVSVDNENSGNYYLKDNDLVFARTGASTGKTYLYNRDDGRLVYAGFLIKVSVDDKIMDSRFLKAYTQTGAYWNWVRIMSTRSGQPGINGNEYSELPVPLPTLSEQKAIAEVLTDTDNTIISLKELIDKKKRVKQGAIQMLLTGKKRLPGFNKEWKDKLLGDIIEVYRGGSPRPIHDYITTSKNGINWIKIGDVGVGAKYIEKTEEKIKPEGRTRSRYVQPGDVLLSNSMSFGRPYILKTDGCIHDGWLVLKNFEESIFPDFLYYLLSSEVILKQYKSKAAGSGVLNLNKKLVSSVKLNLPTLEEQEAIAQVLYDMDDEIEALEEKLEKYKKIKQGMMQELLTGRIRLI